MPNPLITTSRKTSNRIRSFARDLWSVLPGSDRFNRGSMGLSQLISRISASDAECAIIVSTWRGNPGDLTFLLPTGQEALVLRVEGTKLRREMSKDGRVRIEKLSCIALKSGSEKDVVEIGRVIASCLRTSVVEVPSPPSDGGQGEAAAWFETMPSGKILWTFYHMLDGTEIGPRMRVRLLRKHHEL